MTSAWQPIETAPKDRRILLWFPCEVFNDTQIIVGKWEAEKYGLNPRPYWDHDLSRLKGKLETRANQPIHWMELPAPPNGGKETP